MLQLQQGELLKGEGDAQVIRHLSEVSKGWVELWGAGNGPFGDGAVAEPDNSAGRKVALSCRQGLVRLRGDY